jgi:hypothetical protein
MFRNNFNNSFPEINSSTPIGTLNYIKDMLTQQKKTYINLLNENRRIIESINNYIHEYEVQTTIRNPPQSVRPHLFSTNNHTLSNDEILRYTSAHHFNEIEEPLNNRCYLSGIRFEDDDWVCKLPCGHLFDGPSICYHLTRICSNCPICHLNILQTQQPETTNIQSPQRQNENLQPPLIRRNRTINRNSLHNSFNDYSSNGFVELFSIILSNELPRYEIPTPSNLLTEEEIRNAIETIRYGDIENSLSERCPISYIEFTNNTNISRIKHCQHIFETNSLSEWLTRKNTCPVCRYDLKTYNTTNNSNLNTNTDNLRSLYDASGNTIYNRNGYTSTYY